MAVLITGGAGYIGSHVAAALLEAGEEVVVLDNLSTGHQQALSKEVKFYEGDVRTLETLERIFDENEIDAVIHLAGASFIGESFVKPIKFFENNVGGLLTLTKAMSLHGVKRLLFASSASIYEKSEIIPVDENAPKKPASPYAESKRITEQMMRHIGRAHGIKYVSFRFFNVAGASPSGRIGEDRRCEMPLITFVLKTVLGKHDAVKIFGDDYPTVDGTCVRDYVHVVDIANAHVKALEYLRKGGKSITINLGSGKGTSIKEIVTLAEKIKGSPIKTVVKERRKGDIPIRIASIERARKVLGWSPQNSDINRIMSDAWRWHKNNPKGYVE